MTSEQRFYKRPRGRIHRSVNHTADTAISILRNALISKAVVRIALPAGLIGLATFASYMPALRGEFVNDDYPLLVDSTLVKADDGLTRIWFSKDAPDYWPLYYSALWFEWHMWGDDPAPYHAVNIALHAMSAVLLWRILARLQISGAFLAGMIFALHPVMVESVAWISEQKNTLSMALVLASLLAFLRFESNGCRYCYAISLALFASALLSKTTVVALAPSLLLLAWWQRGVIGRKDLARAAPFFFLALAGGLSTIWFEARNLHEYGMPADLPFVDRCLIAGRATWFYLSKLAWPTDLLFIYPRWSVNAMEWRQYLYPLGVAILLGVLWVMRRWSRGPLVAMLIFCAAIAPATGFFNQAFFRYSYVADHMVYFGSAAIISFAAAAIALLLSRIRPGPRALAYTACVALLFVLGILTWRQSNLYANELVLYSSLKKNNPQCWMAWNGVGKDFLDRRDLDKALMHFQEAVRLNAKYYEAHSNLGVVLAMQGKLDEAKSSFERSLAIKPTFGSAHKNLARYYEIKNDFMLATKHLEYVLQYDNDDADAHLQLGGIYDRNAERAKALAQYREVLRIRPQDPEARRRMDHLYAPIP
ncbi:MAG: tetratricopeptide repeat protein [Planctomycetes bacterium]|nr:tetratricopeptide repeat protein [Planctomycetota bacterium]